MELLSATRGGLHHCTPPEGRAQGHRCSGARDFRRVGPRIPLVLPHRGHSTLNTHLPIGHGAQVWTKGNSMGHLY